MGCAGLSYTAYGLIMKSWNGPTSGLRSLAFGAGLTVIYAIYSSARRNSRSAASGTGVGHACRLFFALRNMDTALTQAVWRRAPDARAIITF